ncbi:hypothetical protein [Porphyromonas uenonis]|uniref:hypothetical protein n=1 Tax=Porphyromonas uenonis TaxID=281920 RepID=UPI0012B56D1B|nr:hypothetical protein [Porphyromonas uenonis]
MNILGANGYEEGTTLLCVRPTMDKVKASALLTTLDPPQRYKKGIGDGHPCSLRPALSLVIGWNSG